jgi:hypothetical protein
VPFENGSTKLFDCLVFKYTVVEFPGRSRGSSVSFNRLSATTIAGATTVVIDTTVVQDKRQTMFEHHGKWFSGKFTRTPKKVELKG